MSSVQRNILNLQPHLISAEDKVQFPTFTSPKSYGGYSLSSLGFLENNMKKMRYIVLPTAKKLPLYLRDTDLVKYAKPWERELDNFLEYIVHPSPLNNFLGPIDDKMHVSADIVCTSEVLELMMRAPYEHKEGWVLAVSRYRNTTYICRLGNHQNTEDAFDEHNLTRVTQETRLRKLHQQCLSADGLVLPEKPLEADETDRFVGVFSININGQHVLFDSPVLAENCTTSPAGYMWSELQLRQDNMNRQEWVQHNRNEAIKWWCKGFLLNIQNIYVALQNENAFVHSIKKTALRDLWTACENEWSTSVCANFLVRMLGCINQIMAQIDCPFTVALFDFDATQGEIGHALFEDCNEHTFLPDWFRMNLDERLEEMSVPTNVE